MLIFKRRNEFVLSFFLDNLKKKYWIKKWIFKERYIRLDQINCFKGLIDLMFWFFFKGKSYCDIMIRRLQEI